MKTAMYPMSCHLQQQRDHISLQLHDFAALLLQFPAATLLMPSPCPAFAVSFKTASPPRPARVSPSTRVYK